MANQKPTSNSEAARQESARKEAKIQSDETETREKKLAPRSKTELIKRAKKAGERFHALEQELTTLTVGSAKHLAKLKEVHAAESDIAVLYASIERANLAQEVSMMDEYDPDLQGTYPLELNV